MRTIACGAVIFFLCVSFVEAQSFRIETEVFRADAETPFSKNLTLFTPRAVYDFMLTGNKEMVIFDPKGGRFIILDEARRLKTAVTTEQLYKFSETIKEEVLKGPLESRYLAAPKFTTELDGEDWQVELISDRLIYRARGEAPKSDSCGRRWRLFADWYAYLNATRPGMPPFARLALNDTLAKQKVIPTEVSLTLIPPDRARFRSGVELHSRHLVSYRLIGSDEDRIDKADTYAASFKEVTYQNFRQLKQAANEQNRR